ncbi:Acyl-CoA dehydrogenase family member 11 [Symbiodinium microadriaticum]|uniref:Acyl-CoA dehydrogenase family member 11 n=1 Tax=Symbiodinium microadriaticum TaxID=2951 RepID=A0A1Q9ET59_SYMMI|nr:Acyl-CoA dehydrogenase family member 11 [Symbiodinium microadriaticum]
MTEPAVASSDATNIRTMIMRDGDHWVINGAMLRNIDCKIMILMGRLRLPSLCDLRVGMRTALGQVGQVR